ncbi:hypothetical protein LA56_855 [Francisella philomiragia]|uniref:hypothetical protein n=1 Tax=Francisella philomiragia TaxID=28110 RepID=UPI0005A57884|nr:hypothetical protein [Francisella philomiragia]AJI56039.1 hypothetical protein LA56_855 [Francisella philomiragia]MBK2253592.1 hypothetical protein [Francisella philomiragia]
MGSIFGKQYGYPIVIKNNKGQYIRAAIKKSDGTNKEILSVDKYLKENSNKINSRSKTNATDKVISGLKNYSQGIVDPINGGTIGGLSGASGINTENYIKNLVDQRGDNGIINLKEEVIIYSDSDALTMNIFAHPVTKIVEDINKFSQKYPENNIKLLYTATVLAAKTTPHAVLLIVNIYNNKKKIDLKIVDSLMSHAANESDIKLLNDIQDDLRHNKTSIAHIIETEHENVDFTSLNNPYDIVLSLQNLNIQAPLQTDCGKYVAIWIDAIINGIDYEKLNSKDYEKLLTILNSGKKQSIAEDKQQTEEQKYQYQVQNQDEDEDITMV